MAQRGRYTRAGTPLPRVSATFSPTPRARELLATLPSVVVLRAPRGFGKSSTAAAWLRRADLPDHDVVWVTLPPQPATGASFWRAVDAAVERAGLGEALAVDGWEGVAQVAQARRRRLVLVIDGYDRVRDPQVDEELVALVHAHEELHLALLMRATRPVEALARVAMDTVVMTREDLALGAAQVVELARATGLPVTMAEAARLSEELGGWPGMLRAALLTASRGSDGELVLDTGGLADYLGLVMQDDELAEVSDDLTALAVPEAVTDEVAAHLVGPHVLAAALPRARAAGLVLDGDRTLAYPTTVRDLLRRILREDAPARYRDLNRAMMEYARRSGDPLGAVDHAVRTQDPGAVLDVVEEGWHDLVGHPAAVRAALAHVPAGLLARSAKGRVARDHLLPAEVPTSFLMAVVSGLQPGAGWEDDGADRQPAPGTEETAEEAELLVRLGTQALLDGDPLRATHAFADAEVRLGRHGSAAGPAGWARAGAAVSLALLGHPAAARRYLAGGAADGALGQVATTLVPSLLALDALTPTGAADVVALPPHLAGLEAIALYVRAGTALHAGAAHEVVGELSSSGTVLPGGSRSRSTSWSRRSSTSTSPRAVGTARGPCSTVTRPAWAPPRGCVPRAPGWRCTPASTTSRWS
ncbi:AAA family ATPase [Georgenia yuyongxinii]